VAKVRDTKGGNPGTPLVALAILEY
jgi:hypothetical protein